MGVGEKSASGSSNWRAFELPKWSSPVSGLVNLQEGKDNNKKWADIDCINSLKSLDIYRDDILSSKLAWGLHPIKDSN